MRADPVAGRPAPVGARVGVVIPTLRGAAHLEQLLPALGRQSLSPCAIVVIDSSSPDDTANVARGHGAIVEVIARAEFDHGATRNRGAALAGDVDILVFMAQDALPVGDGFLARLVQPLVESTAAASFARQLPYAHARPSEVFARSWNYPATSRRRTARDIPAMGVRAFFFSNVASAVTRGAFEAAGRFPERTIMNEDMILCSRLLARGEAVVYQAEAQVRHSHDYGIEQQFRRSFDIGVFFRDQAAELAGAAAGGEGLRFAVRQFGWLLGRGHLLGAMRSLVENGARFTAFQLGRRHPLLPLALKRRIGMHRQHWEAGAGSADTGRGPR
jgi:rhamnosyltransferase